MQNLFLGFICMSIADFDLNIAQSMRPLWYWRIVQHARTTNQNATFGFFLFCETNRNTRERQYQFSEEKNTEMYYMSEYHIILYSIPCEFFYFCESATESQKKSHKQTRDGEKKSSDKDSHWNWACKRETANWIYATFTLNHCEGKKNWNNRS